MEDKKPIEHQSAYDPTRPTVGAIYREAHLNNSEDRIEVGDMTNCMLQSLTDDINDCVQSACQENLWPNRDFYITVHEAKDLAMKDLTKRRLVRTVYRPYPEDDTLVFRVNAARSEVRFCWCLPHHTLMNDIIACADLYDKEYVSTIKAWKAVNLEYFGFVKIDIGDKWAMNPHWTFDKDKKLERPRRIIASPGLQL